MPLTSLNKPEPLKSFTVGSTVNVEQIDIATEGRTRLYFIAWVNGRNFTCRGTLTQLAADIARHYGMSDEQRDQLAQTLIANVRNRLDAIVR